MLSSETNETNKTKCPKCGEPFSFHHYFIYEDKVIEVCKECYRKLQVHRMRKVKGKTIVID